MGKQSITVSEQGMMDFFEYTPFSGDSFVGALKRRGHDVALPSRVWVEARLERGRRKTPNNYQLGLGHVNFSFVQLLFHEKYSESVSRDDVNMPEKEQFSKEELRRRLDGHELDLSLCTIVKVPVKQIASFPVVKILDLSCNKISEVPESFCELINLTQLDLSKNCLVSLPPNFGKLKNLKRLDLYSNNLVSLPLSFSDLKLLKWLDLKDNPMQADLFDVVGDCLEPKDCEHCAIKMLNFMRMMKAEDDKRKTKEAEIERVRKLKDASELEQQNELRKRAKLQEKEKRRLAYIEQQKDKPIRSSHQDDEDLDDKQDVKEKQSSALNKEETTSSSILMTLMIVFLVSLFIVLVFYFSTEYYRSIKRQGK